MTGHKIKQTKQLLFQLHYGIEISFYKPSSGERSTLNNDPGDVRDPMVEIIGYKETRYFKHVHNKKDQYRHKVNSSLH